MAREVKIGSFELELPDYISCLSQEDIDKLQGENCSSKIVAAGMHPRDGKVTLVLASGKILIFDGDSYYIPRGSYIPQPDGETVFLQNSTGRWHHTVSGFTVRSAWLISKSTSAMADAELLLKNKSLGTLMF